jgi:hypothetical protein
MPEHEDQIDSEALQATAQLLACSPNNDDSAETRRYERHPFPALQRIAPWQGSELPAEREFFQVKCYDLSRGGISFLLASPPSFKRVVFALVLSSETTYIGAEVAHVTAVRVSRSGSLERIENDAGEANPKSSLENDGRHMLPYYNAIRNEADKPNVVDVTYSIRRVAIDVVAPNFSRR